MSPWLTSSGSTSPTDSLEILFIGIKKKALNNNNIQQTETCPECSKLGRLISHGDFSMTYQEFGELGHSPPDLRIGEQAGLG